MSVCFLDSSALVKRYVAETGSAWMTEVVSPAAGNHLVIARAAWVEVLSALSRRQREGSLAAPEIRQTISAFRYDMDVRYQVAEMDRSLVELAGDIVMRHPLRAYDAIQLASALRVQSGLQRAGSAGLTFISADDRLVGIAQSEGLATDNPNRHQ